MRIGGGRCGSWRIVQVEGCRGKDRQVILVGPDLFPFTGVLAGLGVEFGVAEPFLELGVVEGAVGGGLGILLGRGGAGRANGGA